MKKKLAIILAVALLALSIAACGQSAAPAASAPAAESAKTTTILVPDDESNQTRALLLLAQENLIVLPEDASVENGVSVLDIVDAKGFNIQAAQADALPSLLDNADEGTVAVINYNYALGAGFKTSDALAIEDASGDAALTYANIIAVRRGDETRPEILALVAALQNGAVDAYNEQTGAGIVPIASEAVSIDPVSENVTLKIGASSTPHAELLELVKPVLAEQGIELDIVIYDDYVLPNTALQDGELDANYFQHTPYLNSFNEKNGTDLVSAGLIHYEPFGIYSKTVSALSDIAPAG